MASDPTGTPEPADSSLEIGGLHIASGERIGPYVYRRLVGRGGMAIVVLGTDPDGNEVALKILKGQKVDTGQQRFKREFRALARLRHPNVIRVDAYGDIHGHPYIAMEFVPGIDLHKLIHDLKHEHGEKRWKRCEAVLVDLCRALAYIHRRGLVHRDLKPSNVLIDLAGRCRLSDFGIVKDLDPSLETAVSTTLVGTWAYASPEQIAGQPIDHRSDLYSLGVILFAMLTGRRPFVAKDLAGYHELHRTHQAPSPRDVDPAVPPHLDEICRRLMKKLPRERYRSAQEVLYRLESLDDDEHPPELSPWVPPLVGRTMEEERLSAKVAALTRGEGGSILIEGPAGSGRTRLIEAVAEQAGLMGVGVHRERAAQRDGALGPILRVAASAARLLGDATPRDLIPAVQAFSDPAAQAAGTARPRLFDALVATLGGLLDEGPQVLIVDDLHQAQLATLDALLHLLRALRGRPLLFVGACKLDTRSPRLEAIREVSERLVLQPLSAPAAVELCAALIGAGKPAAALGARLHRETEGNPQFLLHYLHNLVAHGVIAREAAGWRLIADLEDVAGGYFEVPPAVRHSVVERLSGLDPEEREIVEALAVLGREAELDVLLDLLDLDEDLAGDLLDGLCDCGVLKQRRQGEQAWVDFVHPKFAEVLYRELDVERRGDLHRRVATALEMRYVHAPASAELVGEHYRQAGEAGKAFQHLTTAALRLRDRGQTAEAWELSTRAMAMEDAARVDLPAVEFSMLKRSLLEVRADVHFMRGEWSDARDALEVSVALSSAAGNEAGAIRSKMRLARVLRNTGELQQAEDIARENLPRARELHERESVAEGLLVRAHVAWSRGDLDGCEAFAQEGLVLATGTGLSRSRANLLLALTAVQASRGQLASAASGLMEAQALFRELRLKVMRAAALANLAEVTLAQGEPALAYQHGTEALEEAQQGGHGAAEEAARRIRGLCALAAGVAAEAVTELTDALARAEEMGVTTEALACRAHLARARLLTGEHAAAQKLIDKALKDAKSGDPEHFVPMLDALRGQALALKGDAVAARSALARAEATLTSLPVLRRAEVTLEVARGHAFLQDGPAGLPLAMGASRIAAVRGFRLLGLEALALAAMCTAEESDKARLDAEAREGLAALRASLPARWQASFSQRFALS